MVPVIADHVHDDSRENAGSELQPISSEDFSLLTPAPQSRTVLSKKVDVLSFLKEFQGAKWQVLTGLIFFISLSVMFACIGTLTFWKDTITWKGWIMLYVLIASISCLIAELWDTTLTFFATTCILMYCGILSLNEVLAGLANSSIVAIGAMFVIAVAVEKVKLLDWVVRNVLRRPRSVRSALLRILPVTALLSAWTNNTPIVAVMIPMLETWSIRAEIPVSQLLMPVSFSAILGGVCTIIGTSTNLVIQGLAGSSVDLGFFQVGALGVPFTVLGLTFMIVLGPLLLPKQTNERQYIPRVFAWHIVPPGSWYIGQKVRESKLSRMPGAELVWLKPSSGSDAFSVPDYKKDDEAREEQSHEIAAGDMLLFVGVEDLLEDVHGLVRATEVEWTLEGLAFFELYLSDMFEECSVLEFNELFQCNVRFINRHGKTLHGLTDIKPEDVAFVEGKFELLHYSFDCRFKKVLEVRRAKTTQLNPAPSMVRRLHPWIALVGLTFVVVTNAAGLFSLYFAASITILVLVITGILNWKEVIRAIPGNLLLMIAFSFAMAAAMTNSGLGTLLGESFAIAFSYSPYVQLLGIYLVTNIITAVTSNAASASIMYPIVLSLSQTTTLNISAGLFIIMVPFLLVVFFLSSYPFILDCCIL